MRWLVLVLACASTACGLILSDLSSGAPDPGDGDRGGAGGADPYAGGDGSSGDPSLPSPTPGAGIPPPSASDPTEPNNDAGTGIGPKDGGVDAKTPPPPPVCKPTSATFAPASATQETDGTVAWSDPNAVLAGGGGYAEATLEGTVRTKRLIAGTFNVSIPSNAKVLGLQASVRHQNTSDTSFVTPTLKIAGKTLTKTSGTSLQSAMSWWGGESDLWNGGTIAPSSLSGANVTFSFSVQGGGGVITTKKVSIDGVTVTVYYCVPQ